MTRSDTNFRDQPQSFSEHRAGRDNPSEASGLANNFQNDGSFMEMFKRKMDEQKKEEEATQQTTEQKVQYLKIYTIKVLLLLISKRFIIVNTKI